MQWQGKRVFLTGHTGFKGSWLSLWLQQRGALVRGYSLPPPTTPSLFEAAHVAQGMDSCIGDIRDLAYLQRALTSFEPEFVIHLAAQPLVRHSYREPLETYAVNVMGTAHLLEAVRACPHVRSVVIVTTDKCYENHDSPRPFREDDPLGGHDPYSSSKAAAELVTASYRSSFFAPHRHAVHGVAIATARAGNVIGGGDWAPDRLIPDIMRALAANVPVTIRHPHAIRPWQHVLDPLGGYLLLSEALYDHGPAYNGAWNFGPGFGPGLGPGFGPGFGPRDPEALTVQQIVERLAYLWGADANWQLDALPHLHEATQLRLDCSKAAAKLHWQPAFSIDQALELTVAWYAACNQNQPIRDLTLAQIEAYEHRALQSNQGHRNPHLQESTQ